MIIDGADTGQALGVLAVVIATSNTIWGWVSRGQNKARSEAALGVAAKDAAVDVLQLTRRVASTEDALAEHKLLVAQKYVSIEMLEKTETRLLAAISEVASAIRGLGDRIDRNMDRPHQK